MTSATEGGSARADGERTTYGSYVHMLFVCSSNVCRSPIAERLTRAFADQHAPGAVTAESAGTRALVGYPIEPHAAHVIAGLGGNPDVFGARRLDQEMLSRADLVLAMTLRARDEVARMADQFTAPWFTLREAHQIATHTGASTVTDLWDAREQVESTRDWDIVEPVGVDQDPFDRVGDQIAQELIPLLTILTRRVRPRPVAPLIAAST